MQHSALTQLKSDVHVNTYAAQYLREREQKALYFGRGARGILTKHFSRKHGKGENQPAFPPHILNFRVLEDPDTKADAAYLRRWNLHHKRTVELRRKARITFLAYNFLRGNSFEEVERWHKDHPKYYETVIDAVEKLVFSLLDPNDVDAFLDAAQKWEEWRQTALGIKGPEKIVVAAV